MKTSITLDLTHANVMFHDSQGKMSRASVKHIWPQMGKVPGVNLLTENGDRQTSVPHISSVPNATGFYWSLGTIPQLEETS